MMIIMIQMFKKKVLMNLTILKLMAQEFIIMKKMHLKYV